MKQIFYEALHLALIVGCIIGVSYFVLGMVWYLVVLF